MDGSQTPADRSCTDIVVGYTTHTMRVIRLERLQKHLDTIARCTILLTYGTEYVFDDAEWCCLDTLAWRCNQSVDFSTKALGLVVAYQTSSLLHNGTHNKGNRAHEQASTEKDMMVWICVPYDRKSFGSNLQSLSGLVVMVVRCYCMAVAIDLELLEWNVLDGVDVKVRIVAQYAKHSIGLGGVGSGWQ
jgi:hypothetical protein